MTRKQITPSPLPEQTHPYSVRMHLVLGSNLELMFDSEEIRLPFAGSYTLRLVTERTPAREEALFHRRIALYLDAFSSACEAERAGRLLTASLLWFAAFKRVTIGFRKRTGDYLFAIRDRTQSAGLSVEAEGRAFYKVTPDELASVAEGAFTAGVDASPAVLLSMEFYAASRLEATDRARFISLMTALEALAEQRDLGDQVGNILIALAEQLESVPLLQDPDNQRLRASLTSRIKQLRQESVRQAILRTVHDLTNDQEATQFVDDAYGVRSKLLHEGRRHADLHTLSNSLESVLIRMYSSILQLPLEVRQSPVV